jgi:hypothetical protein
LYRRKGRWWDEEQKKPIESLLLNKQLELKKRIENIKAHIIDRKEIQRRYGDHNKHLP